MVKKMSRYVRTKDKIYEIVHDYGNSCAVKSCHTRGRPAIDNFTVKHGLSFAPRADTIEELCDEFIVFGDIDKPYLTRHKFTNKEWNKQYFIGDRKLYGAIWTDKGLIYVAKMNDKGELELL